MELEHTRANLRCSAVLDMAYWPCVSHKSEFYGDRQKGSTIMGLWHGGFDLYTAV